MHKTARALMHVPAGIITGLLCIIPTAAILFFAGFAVYELNEDWRLKDGAYIDLYGWLLGFPAGVALLLVFRGLP